MKITQENRQDEFRELERLAVRFLTQPHAIPKAPSLDGWFSYLRLWHYPAFTSHRSWVVYQQHDRAVRGARTMVRQTTWDYASDAKRLFEPLTGLKQGFHADPTIEVRDRPLDSASFENRISVLRTITFPAFCSRPGGADGEFFGIAFPPPGASVEWWCDGPESWRELTQWAAEAREWLSAIAAVEPQPEQKSPPRLP